MPLIVPSRSFYRHQIVGESSKPMCVAILCRDSPILSTIGFFQPNYAFSHLRTIAVTPTIGAIVCPDIVCFPALLLSQFVLSFLQMRGAPARSQIPAIAIGSGSTFFDSGIVAYRACRSVAT